MADNLLSRLTGTPVVLPPVGSLGVQNTLTQVGFGTPTGIFIDPYQMGKKLIVQGTFIAGTTTGSTASMTIPLGLTNAVQQTPANSTVVGRWWRQTATGSVYKTGALITQPGQTTVNFSRDYYVTAGTGPGNPLAGTSVAATGENVYFEYSMPIASFSDMVAYGAGLATATTPGLVSAQDSGTFAVTLTGGFTANPTGTMSYTRVGNVVTLKSATGLTGVSNATTNPTAAAATLPLSIRPAAGRLVTAATLNNSVNGIGSVVIGSDGSMAFYATPASLAASFAAANNKGVSTLFDAVYTL